MIITNLTRLGAPRCAETAYVGTGAKVVFGRSADMRWFKQREQHLAVHNAVQAVDVINLIPVNGSATGTRLSAPPERSP